MSRSPFEEHPTSKWQHAAAYRYLSHLRQTSKPINRSFEERITLARELGYDVIEFEGGNGKIGAVYGRVSGPEQAINSIWSLKRQRGMANKAEEMQYSAVVYILADMEGISATLGPEDRAGFNRLFQVIELEIADDVFVMLFDRLVRARPIGLEFAMLCMMKGVTIIDETGRVLDPNDNIGFITYMFELVQAEGELSRINARLQGSRRAKALEGRNPGLNIPTGYFTDPTLEKRHPDYDRFKTYEPHIALPTLVLNEVLKTGHNSPKRTLRICRENGLSHLPPFEPESLRRHMEPRSALFRTPRDESGNYIVTTTLVQSIVRNHKWYAGVFEWGKDSEWGPPIRIEDNHPAIIAPVQSREIERILAKKRRGPCGSYGVLPLTGLISSLNAEGEVVPLEYAMTSGYAPRYVCRWEYSRSVPGSNTWSLIHHLVDEPVCTIVLDRLILPDYADQIAAELEMNRQEALESAARYQERRRRLEEEIENLQTNFARVNHPDDVDSIQRQLDQRREKLTELIAEEESRIVGLQIMSERDIETYREFLADLPSLWENADNELRNRFLDIVLEGVYVIKNPTYFDAQVVWYDGEQDLIRVHVPPRYWSREKWTEEEEQYLRENYASTTWRELAEHLGRKEIAIRLRAFNMGLKRKEKNVCAPKRWTEEEIRVLERYSASEMSYEEMREALPDRDEQAVYSKMKHLKLDQPTRPYWYFLPQCYGSSSPSSPTGHKSTGACPKRPAWPDGGGACHSATTFCPATDPSSPSTC